MRLGKYRRIWTFCNFTEYFYFLILKLRSTCICIFILGWCILLRLYINEEIQLPLFATTTYRVFIMHELHYMFRPYPGHLQVYHIYKMLKNYYNFNGSVNVI
jgi:hypothetical protein